MENAVKPLTDSEIRETIRQMLTTWNAATPEQRAFALMQVEKRNG